MTANELIARLMEWPEEVRNRKVFFSNDELHNEEIDNIDPVENEEEDGEVLVLTP